MECTFGLGREYGRVACFLDNDSLFYPTLHHKNARVATLREARIRKCIANRHLESSQADICQLCLRPHLAPK